MTTTDIRLDVNQGDWWQDAEGIIHLISEMDERWRSNCVKMLERNADKLYTIVKVRQAENEWEEAFARGSWGPVMDDPPDREDIIEQAQCEIAEGKHLEWLHDRPQFQALNAGLGPLWREERLEAKMNWWAENDAAQEVDF